MQDYLWNNPALQQVLAPYQPPNAEAVRHAAWLAEGREQEAAERTQDREIHHLHQLLQATLAVRQTLPNGTEMAAAVEDVLLRTLHALAGQMLPRAPGPRVGPMVRPLTDAEVEGAGRTGAEQLPREAP